MTRYVVNFMILLVITLLSLPAAAADGSISVRLTDRKGRSVNGSVKVSGPAKKDCKASNGRCVLRSLKPGEYRITVQWPDGQKSTRKSFKVLKGRTASISFKAPEQKKSTTTTKIKTVAPVTPVMAAPAAVSGVKTKTSSTDKKSSTSSKTQKVANLGKGKKICITGRTTDSRGRSINGTVQVYKNGKLIGTASTRNGRYSIYDLDKGKYKIQLKGQKSSKTVSYDKKSITANLLIK